MLLFPSTNRNFDFYAEQGHDGWQYGLVTKKRSAEIQHNALKSRILSP